MTVKSLRDFYCAEVQLLFFRTKSRSFGSQKVSEFICPPRSALAASRQSRSQRAHSSRNGYTRSPVRLSVRPLAASYRGSWPTISPDEAQCLPTAVTAADCRCPPAPTIARSDARHIFRIAMSRQRRLTRRSSRRVAHSAAISLVAVKRSPFMSAIGVSAHAQSVTET
jgi:hypothetical protein